MLAVGTNVLQQPIQPEISVDFLYKCHTCSSVDETGYSLYDMTSRSLYLLDEKVAIDTSYLLNCLTRLFHFFADLAAHDID